MNDGTCQVQAEFVIQNGEAGPTICGLRVLLNSEDFSRMPGYFSEVVIPQMTSHLIEDVHQEIESGMLWEGAYLTTHSNDRESQS